MTTLKKIPRDTTNGLVTSWCVWGSWYLGRVHLQDQEYQLLSGTSYWATMHVYNVCYAELHAHFIAMESAKLNIYFHISASFAFILNLSLSNEVELKLIDLSNPTKRHNYCHHPDRKGSKNQTKSKSRFISNLVYSQPNKEVALFCPRVTKIKQRNSFGWKMKEVSNFEGIKNQIYLFV